MAMECRIWDSGNASVSPCALTALSSSPAIAVFLICIANLTQPLLVQYRPDWTKPFVQEQPPGYSEAHTAIETRSLKWKNALFLLALVGLCAQITISTSSFGLLGLVLPASWAILVFLIMVSWPRSCPTTWLIFYALELAVELSFMTCGVTKGKLYFFHHGVVAVASCASIFVIVTMPFTPINLSSDKVSTVGSTPSHRHRSPEDNLTLWQFLTLSWLAPMLALGPKRALKDDDVWTLAYQFQHTRLHEQFRKLRGSVLSRIVRANIIDLFMVSLIGILRLAGDYSLPLLLQQLLKAMESTDRSVRVILTYALLSLCARVFSAQMRTLGYWYSRRCYERSCGEMIMMIYDKTLARKNVVGVKNKYLDVANGTADVSRGKDKSQNQPSRRTKLLGMFQRRQKTDQMKEYASTGKILHLIRGDVYQVSQRLRDIDELINVPVGIVMACALIWKILGPSCFLGLVVLLVSQGLNMYFTKILLRWKRDQKTTADARIQATVQFIEVIRHLRWYGWQNHWLDQVLKARLHELRTKAKAMALSVGITNMDMLGRNLFPVVALYSYTYLAGNPLSIDVIFPALQCFQKLDDTLHSTPRLITESISAYIALERIEKFMTEPNKEQEHNIVASGDSIKLEECDFAWPGELKPILRDISIEIQPGLTVIHGKVGAGKSALLQAILGELDKIKGERQVPNNMIGYCSQTPWLQSMTIRDNILFIEPYEEGRYRKVIKACELVPDFGEFKHGDLSIIGEKGIGLSGGQRARVALARAVYSRASMLVLDDPFSALDYKTAKSIVQRLFQGPLVQDRTIVLVTHRIDLIRHLADQVIEVSNGRAEVLSQDDIQSRRSGTNDKSAADVGKEEYSSKPGTPDKFLQDENSAEWGIPLRVNWTFIKAGGIYWWAATIFFSAAFYLTALCCSWFLKAWGEAYRVIDTSFPQSRTQLPNSGNVEVPLSSSRWSGSSLFDGYPSPCDDVRPWLWTYLGISIAQTVQVGYSFTEIMIGLRASTYLFQRGMERVSRATFRYYDVTPVGQLMNRFTSDMSTVDGQVTFHTRRLALAVVGWSIYLGVIASITPSFMVFCVFMIGIYSSIFLRYFLTSQSLRRLHTASVSPLFTHFGELLHGLTTVRAFHSGTDFQRQILLVLDKFQGRDHFFGSVLAWFMYRIELITAVSAFVLTVVAVLTELPPSLTAFMLTTVNAFIGSTHMLARVYGELQMEFISVERVEELLYIEQENPGTVQPPVAWPRFGADIILESITVRYADHLDPALRDITLRIPGGSTVALVGRTGSGKSTLAQALIGVVRPHVGKILIDDMSVDEVDIDTLRQRVTFVAQDPVLFSGTIRHNLDPVEQYSDEECGAVLDRVCGGQGWALTTDIESGGGNLSQGQRQLIGITRAVLRRSTIVILDEATASIDYETSLSIQQVLRNEMTESTVITIAHKIEAVKDVDYAIVMENGTVLRHGPAINMLS